MLYYVVKVKTYKVLPADYTVVKILTNKDDAHTLASIYTRIDNNSQIEYIVLRQDEEPEESLPAA